MSGPISPNPVLREVTRRHLFSQCAMGVGSMALASMLSESAQGAGAKPLVQSETPATRKPHFTPRAKNVIFLFMAGGPSQLELWDYKPKLVELNGKPIPDSYLEGKRFAFMDSSFKNKSTLLGTRRKFKQYGSNGQWVSELFPHQAQIVDDVTMLHTVGTDVFNHAPAKLFMNTGSAQNGRPSM